ncbi:MAG: hypothetical protein QM398_11580 [Thermoproteota archaeon]|nr:hypothetical protein [Thermoproteota archaeon]
MTLLKSECTSYPSYTNAVAKLMTTTIRDYAEPNFELSIQLEDLL